MPETTEQISVGYAPPTRGYSLIKHPHSSESISWIVAKTLKAHPSYLPAYWDWMTAHGGTNEAPSSQRHLCGTPSPINNGHNY